ncbi:MAG: hypothetical protein U9R68_02980 [Planctomycetota bacterium]|nr:hypothetical protein [Planctomycetota bacterium]
MARRARESLPLPELLFCLLILGLVAAVAIPPMVYSRDTRAAQCRANVRLLNRKVQAWAEAHQGWPPADQETLRELIRCDPDLRGHLPKCPYGEPYVYDAAAGRIVPHRH